MVVVPDQESRSQGTWEWIVVVVAVAAAAGQRIVTKMLLQRACEREAQKPVKREGKTKARDTE